jgi:radical SAM superfamily enzyme YgiQ (UPF0313 family)
MHTAMRLAGDVAAHVRELNPDAHLCLYGLYAWLNADYLFAEHLADSVVGGEFEQPLLALARSLETGASPLPSPWERRGEGLPVPGVRFPDQPEPPNVSRQAWFTPQRAGLPDLSHYARFVRDGQPALAGYVEATRGCKHTCSHCPITPVYGGRFFAIPREIVLADVRAQVAAGARHITFGDPDFLNGPTHSLKIARAMHAEFPDLSFDATIKVEHLLKHAAVLPELRELGCAFVVSAVESLSDTVLAHLRKGHTAADVERALELMAAAGIPLRPSLVTFTPWTTLDDVLGLLHFVRRHDLVDSIDPVQYAIRLLIPPGSAILDDAGAGRWLGELDAAAFSYRWRHPDPSMDDLHAEISAIVERGEREQLDTRQTFQAINAAAHQAAGTAPPACEAPRGVRRPPPRLTETWFC